MISRKNIKREYSHTTISKNGNFFFGGTILGEIAIYDIVKISFLDIKKVSNSKVLSLDIINQNNVICSFEDGSLKTLVY